MMPYSDEINDEKVYARKFSRNYLLLLLLLVAVIFFNVIKIFIVPILLAAVFTSLFYPLYEKLLRAFNGRKSLSAITCCLILLVGIIVPLNFVVYLVSQEGIALFKTAAPKIKELLSAGDAGILGKITNSALGQRLNLATVDWNKPLQDIAKGMAGILTTVINKTSTGTLNVIVDLFITLFTMFYFFRDGNQFIERMKYLSPLEDIYEEGLIHRFVSVSRATIRGTLIIGMAQGTFGGLTLAVFGVGHAILWGVVMVILSVIPVVGAWLVLYPAALIQILLGHTWQGVGIFLVTTIVISNIDTLLRPRVVGREAGMHDLMIFFSTLGGIAVFGIMGFIIGPVIAVFFMTLLDIYSIEFKSTLDLAQGGELNEGVEEKADARGE